MITGSDKFKKWFDVSHFSSGLKKRSIRGGVNTVSSQMISFTLNTGSTIVLARLLAPSDYGLVAMVTSITGFVFLFKDLGLAAAVIQRRDINQSQVNSVFWINVIVGLILAILIITLSPFIADFYDDDRLVGISLVYAFSAFTSSFSVLHSALMKRQMMFGKLAIINVVSVAISVSTAIFLAWLGLGYWALVILNITNPLVALILLWAMCDWRPNYIKINSEVKSYIKFGMGITGFSIINYFSRNLDNILIGRFLGANPLGLYSKAYHLLMLPITQIRDPLNAVGTPALSSLGHEPEKYRNYYYKFIFILSFFSMPLVMFLFLFSYEIVLVVLGEQWVEAAIVFQLLAITALIQPVAGTRGLVLISLGMTNKYFIWGIANAVFVIMGFLIGVKWGISGIAISYGIVNYLILIPSLMYCFHGTPIRVKEFFIQISWPFTITLVVGFIVFYLSKLIETNNHIIDLLVNFSFFVLIYFSIWYFIPLFKKRLIVINDVLSLVIQRFKK